MKVTSCLLSVLMLCAPFVSVEAVPIGGQYLMSATNFPNTFSSSGPLTFNATGDLTPEVAGGALLVTEQYFATGTDLSAFRFQFTTFPQDPFSTFGFQMSGVDFMDGLARQLTSAVLSIDFGVSQLTAANVLSFTTSSYNQNGLTVGFNSPVTWDTLFQSTNPGGLLPTSFITTFKFEVKAVPEPTVISLLLVGLLAIWISTRVRRSQQFQMQPGI